MKKRVVAPRSVGARPVAVDLFCGAGGMSLGFEQAGFDILAAVDSDPVHLAVHERNFPLSHSTCADIARISAETIQSAVRKGWSLAGRVGEWEGMIDCLFGGPSCQGFSDMGRQAVDDERNKLVFSFARLVKELEPRTFVIENVPGLLFPKVRNKLDELLKELKAAGYDLQQEPPTCYDAADFGVPQRRRRVFIVGVVGGSAMPPTPRSLGGATVSTALDDLPDVDVISDLLTTDRLVLSKEQLRALRQATSPYTRSLRSRRGLGYARVWDRAVLTGCQQTLHSAEVRNRFLGLKPGEEDEVSRTSRLAGEGRAQTLRAGTGRDHGSFTAPRPIHHRRPRVITVREAARLHSFPDWFAFHEAKWHALREIGNSVPPRLAEAVAKTIIRSLDARPTKPMVALMPGDDALLRMSLLQAADYYGIPHDGLPRDVRR